MEYSFVAITSKSTLTQSNGNERVSIGLKKIKLATVVEGDQKASFFNSY